MPTVTRNLGLLAAIAALGIASGGTTPAVPAAAWVDAADANAPPSDGPQVVVKLARTSFAIGEPVRVATLLRNPGTEPVLLSSMDWTERVFRVVDADHVEPLIHHDVDSLLDGPQLLPPRETILAQGEWPAWDQVMPDGTPAPPGLYAYVVAWNPPVALAAVELFAIGAPETLSPLAGQASLLLGRLAASDTSGGPDGPDATGGAAGYGYGTRRWYSMPVTWRYNSASEPASVLGQVQTNLNTAFNAWETDAASYLDYTYGGATTRTAPDATDGQFVIAWRGADYFGAGSATIARVITTPSATDSQRIVHADEMWNTQKVFSTTGSATANDVLNVATHEAGHWIRLLDLNLNADSEMTMYGSAPLGETKKRSLEWGDRSGLRYVYPSTHSAASGIGDSTAGADLALSNFDGAGQRDLIYAWVDDPSGGNTIYYRLLSNLDAATGQAGTVSATKTAFSGVGASTSGLALAVGSIDATASPDLVVAWVDNPAGENTIYFKVGWNVNNLGNAASWSATKTVGGGGVGWYSAGAGACLRNLDANARPDLVVAWVDDPSGGNSGKFRIGWNLDALGNAAGWSSTKTVGGGTIGDTTAGAGLACTDADENGNADFLFGWVDNPSGDNRVYYRIGWNPNAAGDPASWSATENGPGANAGIGHETAGFGVAAGDLDAAGIDEIVFAHVDNPSGANTAYYKEEWNLRYNAH